MHRIWRTIKSYIWWTYGRGSFHYDVMVTVILLFIFLSPRVINYKDKPLQTVLTPQSVIVTPDGHGGLFFQVDASAIKEGADRDQQLLHVIEAVGGEVKIISQKELKDRSGRTTAYVVQVQR